VLQIDVKEQISNRIFIIWIVAAATIDFSLIQARLPIESEAGRLSGPILHSAPLTAAILSGCGYRAQSLFYKYKKQ
jgi:hypothetical protein